MSISFNDKIVVTGGAGFLGKHVVNELIRVGYNNLIVIRSADYNLINQEDVAKLYYDHKPDVVVHLAAVVGGIGINKLKPGTFFYSNLMMGTLMMEYAYSCGVKKFTAIGTICSYPCNTPVPFKESDLWDGYPEVTNAPYGLAKKMMLVQSKAYREQFGFNSIFLLPVNLYGPGDNFNDDSSHVIPALIKKCVEAKKHNAPFITCWGSGSATREFLYVTDAAEAIVKATLNYNSSEPMNIGSNKEISIKELITIIAGLVDYTGDIVWDTTKSDGQPRRCLDTSKAKLEIDFEAKTNFIAGLKETIKWYNEQFNC